MFVAAGGPLHSVNLLRAASDPSVREMPEGHPGQGRRVVRLSPGKPPRASSFRPPLTSIMTRSRWPRSSTRRYKRPRSHR